MLIHSQDAFLVIVSVVEIFSQFMATQRLEAATSNFDTMSNMRVSSSDLDQRCGNKTGAVVASSGAGGSILVLGFQSRSISNVLSSSCGVMVWCHVLMSQTKLLMILGFAVIVLPHVKSH